MDKRKTDGDEEVVHFRASSRIFRLNDGWYFSSREGDQGPFQSEAQAQKEVDAYVKTMSAEVEFLKPYGQKEREDPNTDVDPKVWDQFDRLS